MLHAALVLCYARSFANQRERTLIRCYLLEEVCQPEVTVDDINPA